MPKDNGGPAFPMPPSQRNPMEVQYFDPSTAPGMSLRDYFAIHASDKDVEYMQNIGFNGEKCRPPSVEEARFMFADAMIAERNK